MAATTIRLVVLTNDSRAGRGTLAGLARRGIPVAGVVVESAHQIGRCRRASSRLGRLVETPLALARSLWRRVRAHRLVTRHAGGAVLRLLTGKRDSDDAMRFIARAEADVLVIAGVGLVSVELLAIPRLGSLNAHPGLVPWVRGNGAVCNAILRGVAIGATCHRVDAGIDTGPVLARRLLPVRGGESLEELEQRAVDLSTDLLLDIVVEVAATGALPDGKMQDTRYPLCRWQDASGRAAAADLIAAGRASELYKRWKSLCADPRTDDLPTEIPAAALSAIAIAPLKVAHVQTPD